MITFQKLGEFGRRGNQLFQLASTMGVALDNGTDFAFPGSPMPNKPPHCVQCRGFRDYYEVRFEHDRLGLRPNIDWNLIGYFQSHKYFAHHWDKIKQYFEFDQKMVAGLSGDLKAIAGERITVAVHVRRGDYLNLQEHHPVQPMSYFIQAMANFNTTSSHFIIFSDDPEWCEEKFKVTAPHLTVFHKDELSDLCMGSLCDHNIISNSSFSWWQAWLNKNPEKRVIAPRTWFGPAYAHKSTRDLIPENWMQI